MKNRLTLLLLGAMLVANSLPAQTRDEKGLVGVWRGQVESLPAVTLNITDEGGGVSGAILFYLLRRNTVNDPYTSSPGIPEPLLSLKFNGNSLEFQVSHRRAHPPQSLSDPPVRFRLTLKDPGHAELVNESERAPSVLLIRDE